MVILITSTNSCKLIRKLLELIFGGKFSPSSEVAATETTWFNFGW
jgi:hypothetical protein